MSGVYPTLSGGAPREHSGRAPRDLGQSQAKREALREFVRERRSSVELAPGELTDALVGSRTSRRVSHMSGGSLGGGRGGAPPGKWLSPAADLAGSWMMLRSSWLNVLIIAAPLGLAAELLGWGPSTTFVLNLMALIPLALLLGCVTEDLSIRLGEIMGALLNATFGNVVEIILSISALFRGLYQVVATSLLGSILSNMLFVLGMSFMAGGFKYKIVTFNALAAQSSISLLLLIGIAITLPTAALHLSMGGAGPHGHLAPEDVLLMSRITAVALLVVYFCYLYFQMGSHSEMFSGPQPGAGNGGAIEEDSGEGEDEEGEEPMLSLGAAALWLGVITGLVAVCSEALTGSIEEVSHAWGLSQGFLGFIVLPIAGNACEHVTAVFVAMKNKMDLSMGIAIGSSIQIGLLAVPLVTVIGWATGHPFSLAFDPFSALVLVLSVFHTSVMIADSESNWLEGMQLIVTYFIIAVAYAMTT
ncbi:calcium proton exchanger protein [Raphidocelis subcapitata]|uniref:Vacuolar cation/proton exchanger n=1 Tax=Raphidocelis subcapitata TaxID=307507 RepID=A0A2V0NRV9_9CHLO|nr:calcium proton exchanger protein [Raphidocelis subcapitata]|eukprot:GBF90059.1 calcium proton exchanger protein [Raphidocelis subcapitata]